jgi:hypothetical protein
MVCSATLAAAAVPPLPIQFGNDVKRLQNLVDQQYGPGHIDVTKDFVGAHAGDIDPWFWVGYQNTALQINLLRLTAHCQVGWYLENGSQPKFPEGGGLLFSGETTRKNAAVTLTQSRTLFGFYIGVKNRRRTPWVTVPGSVGLRRFYSNRKLNDCGEYGSGATHAPFDGDIQALVFDVSPWAGSGTWLVCFEDRDTGGPLIEDEDADDVGDLEDADDQRRPGSDNGFDDVVFEVKADGATPSRSLSFGALKLIYR